MKLIFAIIAFAAGQAFLMRNIIRLDHFLEHPNQKEEKKNVLSVVFVSEEGWDRMRDYLEGFSVFYPDVEVTVYVSEEIQEVVCTAQNTVGFLPLSMEDPDGLNVRLIRAPGEEAPCRKLVWFRRHSFAPVNTFIKYLWDRGAICDGNSL